MPSSKKIHITPVVCPAGIVTTGCRRTLSAWLGRIGVGHLCGFDAAPRPYPASAPGPGPGPDLAAKGLAICGGLWIVGARRLLLRGLLQACNDAAHERIIPAETWYGYGREQQG